MFAQQIAGRICICVLILAAITPVTSMGGEIVSNPENYQFWQVLSGSGCGPPDYDYISDEVSLNRTLEQLIGGLENSTSAGCDGGTGQAWQQLMFTIDPETGAWHGEGHGFAAATGSGGPDIPSGAGGDADFWVSFDVVGSPVEFSIIGSLHALAEGAASGQAAIGLEMLQPNLQVIWNIKVLFTKDENGTGTEAIAEVVTLEPATYQFYITLDANGAPEGGDAVASYDAAFDIAPPPGEEPGPPADCDAMNWTGAADEGAFSKLFANDENWADDQPPEENHVARFTAAALSNGDTDFDIAFPGPGNTTNAAIVVRAVQPNIDLATGTYTLTGDCPGVDSIEVGVDGGLLSDLLFKNGTVLADNISVGKLAGEQGFLNVISQGAISADGLCTIGDQGEGNLLVQIGGAFEAVEVTLGQNTTGVGHAFVTDPGSDMTIDPGGTLTVGFRGNADLLVGNQAKLDDFGDLLVGEQAGASGLVTINGEAMATVAGSTVFGKNGTGLVSIVGIGSSLTCGGVTTLAEGADSLAVVEVKEGGALTTQDALNIGVGGDGTLNITGGFSVVNSLDATLGATATGKGAVSITNGGTWNVLDSLQVGAVGPGVVSVDATSTLQAQLLGVTSVGTLDATVIHIGAGTGATAKALLAAQATKFPGPGVFVETLVVEPGAKLNVDAVALDNRGVLELEIGGPNAGVDYQVMAIAGTANLSGTLRIKLINDYALQPGQRYEVMTYAARAGEFAVVENLDGYAFEIVYGPNSLTLVVAGGEPPAAVPNLCGVGCGPLGLMPLGLTALVLCSARRRIAAISGASGKRGRTCGPVARAACRHGDCDCAVWSRVRARWR